MKKRSLILVVCFICSSAYALGGDNTHSQGVRLAGRGFDESVAEQPPADVPWFSNKAKPWPPQGAFTYDLGGSKALKVDVTCPQPPRGTSPDPRFALCFGLVTEVDAVGAPIGTKAACDSDNSGIEKVPLLAIRGAWKRQGHIQLDDDVVTFACAPTFPKETNITSLMDFRIRTQQAARLVPQHPFKKGQRPVQANVSTTFEGKNIVVGKSVKLVLTPLDLSNIDKSHNLGVLAKCYFWGFAKLLDVELKTYEACVRAARADYCGNGKSQTQPGTWIQIFEPKDSALAVAPKVSLAEELCQPIEFPPPPSFCFEALWDEDRALCVSHDRFEQLRDQDCEKTQFQNVFYIGKEGELATATTGVEIRCTESTYDQVLHKARIKNRSFINDLDGGVHSCVNEIPCP
jgi:hypothetical protein